MEKTIIAALLMLISLISYAQGLMWTAKAELNMSSMSNVEESKMHPGFYAGIGAGYVIDETRSVRPSLLFTMKGVKQDYKSKRRYCIMKKLFFIMAMSVCAFTAQAQTTSGIRVGLNMTSATGKYNDLMADQDYNNKSYMGYSIHYFIDVPVIGNFSIQPAVGLSMKGITYEYDKFTTKKSHRLDLDSYKKYDVTESRGTSVTQKHNLGYLDVPILFAYALPLSESFRVQLGVGPYFSYGLFGKFKYESDKYLTVSPDKYGENKHTITKDDYPSFGKNDDADDPKGNINRFDWGIAVQGSIYWKRLFLNVAYQKGLKSANITDEKNEGKDKLALSNLSLGLGFIF